MTQVFYSYIDEENHNRLLKEMTRSFPIDFQNKISKYKRWQDAQLSILGRVLLSQGLKKINKKIHTNDLHYTVYSKPYFKNNNIEFNISHSGNMVVCAISETSEIGIDVEIVKTIKVEDYKSQMTSSERQHVISSKDNREAFYHYWTKKEAVIKAHGNGLSIPIKSFEIVNHQTKINNENFFLKEITLDNNYVCYLAFKNKIDSIILNPPIVDLSIP